MKAATKSIDSPPKHLSPHARALWAELALKAANTPSRRAMFQTALECIDLADEARASIKLDGLFTTTVSTGAVHAHPGARIVREATAQYIAIFKALGLAAIPNPAMDALIEMQNERIKK